MALDVVRFEFGSLDENVTALEVGVWLLSCGDPGGAQLLHNLRTSIKTTQELKSTRLLLPLIDARLAGIATAGGDSDRREPISDRSTAVQAVVGG